MKCEKCGAEIRNLLIEQFRYDGSDDFDLLPIVDEQDEGGAVIVDTDSNWCGFGLSEEEQIDTIKCPVCKNFPFEGKEIQVYEIVRLVMFAGNGEYSKEETYDS